MIAPARVQWGEAFVPRHLPGAMLWLRPDASGVTTSGGTNVTGLLDQSGRNNHVATFSGTPTVGGDAALGGQPAVDFPGTALMLFTLQWAQVLPITLYAVIRNTETTTAFRALLDRSNPSNAPGLYASGNGGTPRVPGMYWNGLVDAGVAMPATYTLLRMIVTSGTLAVRCNGSSNSVAHAGTVLGNWTSIGSAGGGQYLKACLADMLMVQGKDVTADGDAAMVQYVSSRYGVT